MTAPLALVAGGSRGLGYLIAEQLLRRGYRVALCARSDEDLQRAAQQLSLDGEVTGHVCDVGDRAAVTALVEQLEQQAPIEVAITVAGIIQVGPAESVTFEHFDAAIATMLMGPINVAWSVLPHMRERDRGRIATVASIGGIVSPPHLLPYATAKFGAVGFSDGLAAALAGTGVRATTVVPGLMRTGSHERAQFIGDAPREYAWFGPSASLPGLAMNAERAAERIVRGVLAGDPWVSLTPVAWVGTRFRGLFPGTTVRLMGMASSLMPSSSPGENTSPVEGRVAERRLNSRVVRGLTTLGRRAAQRTNERQ